MDDRCLSTELDVFDLERCETDLSSPKEVEVKGDGVRLVLLLERCVEVLLNDLLEGSCDISTMRYCGSSVLWLSHILVVTSGWYLTQSSMLGRSPRYMCASQPA